MVDDFFFNFFFQRLFIFRTERDRTWTGEGQRERGHRIGNRLQAPSHQPRAWRGARTHAPRDRDLAEVGRLTDCATQAPQCFFISEGERERQSLSWGGTKRGGGASEWLNWLSVQLWLRSWSHSLWVWAPRQAPCCQLRAWSSEPGACFRFCLPSLPLPYSHSVSVSQKWVNIKENF